MQTIAKVEVFLYIVAGVVVSLLFFLFPRVQRNFQTYPSVNGGFQVFGQSRNNSTTPPEATTHPLLLNNSTSCNRSPSNQSRVARQVQQVSGNGAAELLQTIDDLIGGGAIQLFQQLMTQGRGGGGPETIRLDMPAGTVVNLERAYAGQRRHGVYSASVQVERAPTAQDDRAGCELEPQEGIRQEALARAEAEAAEEKAKAEQAAKEEAGEAARREAEEAVARQAGPVPSAVSTLEEDQTMEDAVTAF
jgi:E3 ubiquitin-protein ligase HUWE1